MSIPRHDDPAAADHRRRMRAFARLLLLLQALAELRDGFEVSQLQHSLQTAARAESAGASQEMVLAALLHDVGKPLRCLYDLD